MSHFAVPYSSSPPTTPDSQLQRSNGLFSKPESFVPNPSTTPAGPPSSTASFTPAGPPPPSSMFGNSQHSNQAQNKLLFKSNTSLVPSLVSPLPSDDEETNEDYDDEEESQEYSEGSEEGNMELDIAIDRGHSYSPSISTSQLEPFRSSAGGFDGGFDMGEYGSSVFEGTPRGIKRSRGGAAVSHGSSPHIVRNPGPKKESAIPAVVKDMATQMGPAMVHESVEFTRKTEDLVSQLHAYWKTDPGGLAIETEICTVVEKLRPIWHANRSRDLGVDDMLGVGDGILPDDSEPNHYKATFLATFLLQLHHPPAARGMQAPAVSRNNGEGLFSATAGLQSSHRTYKPAAFPKVLLDWLSQNYQPYEAVIEKISTYDPNPTAHDGYWDMILSMIIRGRLSEVIKLLKKSDFQQALTAKDDGQSKAGYEGIMLKNVDRVVNRAIQILELCPALQYGDWDLAGTDWLLFRRRVEQAVYDLSTFAEGRDRDMDAETPGFEAANFGIRPPDAKISRSARKAGSQVPWSVYQSVKIMYGILLGETTEIVTSAQDWIEATIGLTAWWNGEDEDEIAVGNLATTRRSLRKTQRRGSRFIDINPTEAYLRQLAHAFERITDDENQALFQVSSINPIEVGLASIFEGNVEGVIGLLRGWSLPVASATAEIASLGGWYNPAPSNGMLDDFDESDLLVLSSYGPPKPVVTLDSILIDYAEKLADMGFLGDPKLVNETPEGWELSASIFSRLQDVRSAEKKLLSLIQSLPLESGERVDKIVRTCNKFGMENEAFRIAERYADFVAENTDDYGLALMYYARAHSHIKVKNVFDLLISLSVVHSVAFPPLQSLDSSLGKLISEPAVSLERVALHDPEAARLLHLYLTGYATLRKFYDLRDEEHVLAEGEQPKLRPLARKRAAAAALIAVISSAADNIYGGLYDESRNSVVHVDSLMALLGEAMVFVNRMYTVHRLSITHVLQGMISMIMWLTEEAEHPAILSRTQNLALLSAIESLETVSGKIYTQCEDCFLSTLSSYRNSQTPPSSRGMMRKTISSLTSSSGFSLVGSEMLGESMTSGGASDSMVKVGGRRDRKEGKQDEFKRGWDWRKGMRNNAKGKDMLRILRLGLANDMAREWVAGS